MKYAVISVASGSISLTSMKILNYGRGIQVLIYHGLVYNVALNE